MNRIAFLGSATDPFHWGHLAVIDRVRTSGLFDLVIFFPSGFSQFKPNSTSTIHRAQLAILGIPKSWLFASRPTAPVELNLSNVYREDVPTIVQFEQLEHRFPEDEITWVTGSDWATPDSTGRIKLETFHRSDELMTKNVLVIPRPGYVTEYQVSLPDNFHWLSATLPDLSSSGIAAQITQGDPIWRNHVPIEVAAYIIRNRLYGYQPTKG